METEEKKLPVPIENLKKKTLKPDAGSNHSTGSQQFLVERLFFEVER